MNKRGKNIDKKIFKQIHRLTKQGWLLSEIAEEFEISEFTANQVLKFKKFCDYEYYKEQKRIAYYVNNYNEKRKIKRNEKKNDK
jgi:orotate phosphoribosyltransferase-like protein